MKSGNLKIGKLVKKCRLDKGFTQLDIAQLLGYEGIQFISLFESGRSKIPTETLGKLIVILGIPERKLIRILLLAFQAKMSAELSVGKSKALRRAAKD